MKASDLIRDISVIYKYLSIAVMCNASLRPIEALVLSLARKIQSLDKPIRENNET